MVPIRQPKVAVQHPFWGGVSTPTPGASAPLCSYAFVPEQERKAAAESCVPPHPQQTRRASTQTEESQRSLPHLPRPAIALFTGPSFRGWTHDPQDRRALRASLERKKDPVGCGIDRHRMGGIVHVLLVDVHASRLPEVEPRDVAAFGGHVEPTMARINGQDIRVVAARSGDDGCRGAEPNSRED